MTIINYTTRVDPKTGLIYFEWANIQKVAGVTVGDETQILAGHGLEFISGWLEGTVSGATSMNYFTDNAYDEDGLIIDPSNSQVQTLASLPVVFAPMNGNSFWRKVRFEGTSALVFDLTLTAICRSL